MKYASILKSNNPSLELSTAELHANQAVLAMEQKLNKLNGRRTNLLLEKNTLEASIKTGDAETWVNRMYEISKNLKMVDVEIEIATAMKKEWFS